MAPNHIWNLNLRRLWIQIPTICLISTNLNFKFKFFKFKICLITICLLKCLADTQTASSTEATSSFQNNSSRHSQGRSFFIRSPCRSFILSTCIRMHDTCSFRHRCPMRCFSQPSFHWSWFRQMYYHPLGHGRWRPTYFLSYQFVTSYNGINNSSHHPRTCNNMG